MKYLLIIIIMLMHITVWAQSKKKVTDCRDSATTTLDMVACAALHYQETDDKLNRVYKAILKEYKNDTAFIKNLKTAELIWIQSRDAEVKVMYPEGKDSHVSLCDMCELEYLEILTKSRINYLQQWLDGEKDGDVCGSSVKIRHK